MEQIGKRLRALREGVRLTQVNMAEILGVQQSRINRYETGQSTPAPEIFIKYADYFDVSMDYLAGKTEAPLERRIRKELEGSGLTQAQEDAVVEIALNSVPIIKRLG